MPRGEEEPRLVPFDRPAERRREHVNVLDAVGGANAERRGAELVVDVVRLPVAAAEAEERRAAEHVAAVFQHAVQANPAARRVRRNRARHDGDFRLQHVVEVRLRGSLETLDRHPLDQLLGVVAAQSVGAEAHLLGHAGAADIGRAGPDSRRQHTDRHDVAGDRQRVDDVAGEHLRPRRLRHVDLCA